VASPEENRTPGEADRPDEGPQEEGALAAELTKVLRIRRWREQEGPFQGFNSPPGRF